MGRTTKITAGDVMLMEELRKQGLANQQIALDMGLNTKTVTKYIGNQGKKVRAPYGSLVAHPSGEKFSKHLDIPEALAPVKIENNALNEYAEHASQFNIKSNPVPKLKKTGSIITYKGYSFAYTVDMNNDEPLVTIQNSEFGTNFNICGHDLDDFTNKIGVFIDELHELASIISKERSSYE